MELAAVVATVVPIGSPMRNAVIDFSSMTVAAVGILVVNDDGQAWEGFGFHSNGRYAPLDVLEHRLFPRLRAADPGVFFDEASGAIDPVVACRVALANEKPGGHGERAVAAGALDMALWDVHAKQQGLPLWKVIAQRHGRPTHTAPSVKVYAAGGYYYEDGPAGIDRLRQEMHGYRDLGFHRCKMKIGGTDLAEDIKRIEAVLDVVGDGRNLAVDANGRFGLQQAIRFADAVVDYDLAWYEEPCDPLDYLTLAALADHYPGRIATGENLLSLPDVRNLLRYGGMRPTLDLLQMDPALAYGLVEYESMLDAARAFGWSPAAFVPHGGHQFNLHIAAGLGLEGIEAYPGVFEPIGGFGERESVADGHVTPADLPGIGLEGKASLEPMIDELRRLLSHARDGGKVH